LQKPLAQIEADLSTLPSVPDPGKPLEVFTRAFSEMESGCVRVQQTYQPVGLRRRVWPPALDPDPTELSDFLSLWKKRGQLLRQLTKLKNPQSGKLVDADQLNLVGPFVLREPVKQINQLHLTNKSCSNQGTTSS